MDLMSCPPIDFLHHTVGGNHHFTNLHPQTWSLGTLKSANMSFDMIHFLKDTFLGFEGLFQTLPPSHVSFPYSFAVFINILQLASSALVVYPMINDVFKHHGF